MTEIEHDTLVMTIRTERDDSEPRDAIAERLANSVRLTTGVVGASVLGAETLDELRDDFAPKLVAEVHQAWRVVGDLADFLDQSVPELVETAFGRGVASMLLQLQQEEAFARHDLAEGLRFGAEMAWVHRGAVRANRHLQLLAAEFAGLLDAVTGVATEERAGRHLQTIRQLIGADADQEAGNEGAGLPTMPGQEDG